MVQRFLRQFSRPTGPLGRIAGRLMARKNVPLNRWVSELLELEPADRMVEVGFGPGVGVALHAQRAGRVSGVDLSDVMVRQARRRNRAGVRDGRIDLREGSASKLPFPDAAFTKACTVNSLQFWPAPGEGLAELHRVLAPGGLLVVALRMRRDGVGRYDRSRFGLTQERLDQVAASAEAAGFRDVAMQRREIAGETITALLARR